MKMNGEPALKLWRDRFDNPALGSQQTFRSILAAMDHPGQLVTIREIPQAPDVLNSASAATCLTLLDYETPVWTDVDRKSPAISWLQSGCGGAVVTETCMANFAIITKPAAMPALDRFRVGQYEYPDKATTIVVQVDDILPSPVNRYSEEKYDFISITDHWCFPQLNGNRPTSPLLVINGVELDGYDNLGTYYHVLAIGASLKPPLFTGNFFKTLRSAYSQGAVLIWAHPYWTGNSIQEGMRHKFHGLEIYNHSSQCENGSGYALAHRDGMLSHNPDFLGFATDDSHFLPDQQYWKGGWIMVNAAECSQQDILEGIRQGNFYATQGPEFKTIQHSDNKVTVETSAVSYVRLIGPRRTGKWIQSKWH
jgi:phosphonate C-P lyase system protein PhnH